MAEKTRKFLKLVEWVLPLAIPLLAILLGGNLYRAIIERNTFVLVMAIFCCICVLGATFANSRALLHLGAIKALEDMRRFREYIGLDKLEPNKD